VRRRRRRRRRAVTQNFNFSSSSAFAPCFFFFSVALDDVGMDLEADPADELIAMFGKIRTSDPEALCEQFSKILNVDAGVARFFLEASSWSVEQAVHAYLNSVEPSHQTPRTTSLLTHPQATFCGDLSPLETALQPGDVVHMMWTFRNTGSEPWPAHTKLVFVDGNAMGGFTHASVPGGCLPGQQVVIMQQLRAPMEFGEFSGTWRLMCAAGYFGDPLWVFMSVQGMMMTTTSMEI
jgi:hypothetical protein